MILLWLSSSISLYHDTIDAPYNNLIMIGLYDHNLKIFKVKLSQFKKCGLNYPHFNNCCLQLSIFFTILLI